MEPAGGTHKPGRALNRFFTILCMLQYVQPPLWGGDGTPPRVPVCAPSPPALRGGRSVRRGGADANMRRRAGVGGGGGPGGYIQRRGKQINKASQEGAERAQAGRGLHGAHGGRCRCGGEGMQGLDLQGRGAGACEGRPPGDRESCREVAALEGLLPVKTERSAPPGVLRRATGRQVASPGWGSPSSSWFCFSSLILQRREESGAGSRPHGVGVSRVPGVLATCVGSAAGTS